MTNYRNISLEQFYTRIDEHIKVVAGYLESSLYEFIIKSCRLKPYSSLFMHFDFNPHLETLWVDEHSNSLIIEDHKAKLILNDLSLDWNRLLCTDPYYGLSIHDVWKNSKLCFLMEAKLNEQEHYIKAFLCNDNYLRTFIYIYDHWEKYPSLYLGLKTLNSIYKNLNIKDHVELKENEFNHVFPCSEKKAWISKIKNGELVEKKLNV